ncbi:conserved exported hypothetical protein [uncultured Paludibacter sp.]|uniref:Uncharacterized protein n=1 Tax=uncultured Paludibacter sp. TaxID=497635 RepID=A0A653ACD7_9BACT|nr:conserved exported hypothetical protein [uncultured Paludibacter sp.]
MNRLYILLFSILSIVSLQAQENDTINHLYENPSDSTIVQKEKSHLAFNGQVTAWSVFQFTKPMNTQIGGRFVPVLTGNWKLSEKTKLDFEASLHLNGTMNLSGTDYDTATYVFKPYRLWARYFGENWEIRGGLQQINFGSARMFRPLMWFDGMDPRDPLKLTDGVYGVLGKYFFENNANIWFWTLLGNKNRKGFELLGSATWVPEIGGRAEMPIGPGEIAVSTHFRKADIHSLISSVPEKTYINESRIGLDGKWDVGIGLWFESSISMFEKSEYPISIFNDMWNLGADYTIPVGSGLGVTFEYFRYHIGTKIWKEGEAFNLLGSMFTYPVSLIDNASAMFFYVNEAKGWFNYLSYKRTYDNWDIYLIGFWNPEINLPLGGNMSGKNLFSGKGLQLMVNYNF